MLDQHNFQLYIESSEIQSIVAELGKKISQDYHDKELILIGVLKGAIVFMGDLVRHIECKTQVDFVRLSSYGKGRESSGTVSMVKDISLDIKDKHVLIVEEIIDSGRTLKYLFDRLKTSQPASVEIVTLLDKPARRVVDVPVKYVGKTTSDQFLIGYGLDLEEKCRNLPDIHSLKYPN